MKTLRALIVLAFMSLCVSAEAKKDTDRITALRINSSENEWVGKGKDYLYDACDGEFTIYTTDRRRIEVRFSNGDEEWFLAFSAPEDELLEPDVYSDAMRYSYSESKHPGLAVEMCNRGYDFPIAEFEILEIEYGIGNQINAFAANFTQKGGADQPSLSGSIRYNSQAPLDARFAYEEEICFQYYKRDSGERLELETASIQGNGLISIFPSFFPLYSDADGIEVIFKYAEQICRLVFTAPAGEHLKIKNYHCPFHLPPFNNENPTIRLDFSNEFPLLFDNAFKTPRSTWAQDGSFQVLVLEKLCDGIIGDFAIKFTITNCNLTIEGTIRKSYLPHPWKISDNSDVEESCEL